MRRVRRGFERPAVSQRGHPAKALSSNLKVGELSLHRDGYGFVVVAGAGDEDIFIPARFIGDALHTDVVEARSMAGRGGKIEGRITRIIERRVKSLMGRFERHGKLGQVVADDRRVRHRIIVRDDGMGGARHGDNVIVRILRYPDGDVPMLGEVIEVLGKRGETSTEKLAVMARHQLPRSFSTDVLDEARRIVDRIDRADPMEGRTDLSDIPFVTIDGENAKDFDDAVAVKKMGDGAIRLWVSIADVSFFVRPGSKLDRSAFERGTSVYFPNDCLPMLPEILSNDRCSLRPNERRLTMTAELDVGTDGAISRRRFYRSAIESRERMTYTSIKNILVDKDDGVRRRYTDLVPQFELMEGCFKRLRKRRIGRGSIDFDLPEPEIIIDIQGEISDIVKAERHVGHMMIEEFMIAANEAVAEFLTGRGRGCIYRVHERPPADKLKELSILIHNLGHKIHFSKDVSSAEISRVVDAVRGGPEERFVNHMILRSMAQAVYSDENLGHFGLASRCYCHFTSPIRRYPDLVVHRLLAGAMDEGASSKQNLIPLKEISAHCSKRERVAVEAEREMLKLHSALFMQEKIGDTYEGVISHVTKFGFFVELLDFFVEGLVHIDSLDDDKYAFEEKGMVLRGGRRKSIFKIGDRVRIEVSEVDIPDREILFLLA